MTGTPPIGTVGRNFWLSSCDYVHFFPGHLGEQNLRSSPGYVWAQHTSILDICHHQSCSISMCPLLGTSQTCSEIGCHPRTTRFVGTMSCLVSRLKVVLRTFRKSNYAAASHRMHVSMWDWPSEELDGVLNKVTWPSGRPQWISSAITRLLFGPNMLLMQRGILPLFVIYQFRVMFNFCCPSAHTPSSKHFEAVQPQLLSSR